MRIPKSLLIVASATLAFAQDAIVSKAVFSGKDTTNLEHHGSEIYENLDDYPTAAASLLVHAAENLGYEPFSRTVLKDIYPYQALERKLRDFRGFTVRETRTQIELTTEDRDDLYTKVKNAYDGVENKIIAATIRNLVPKTNTEDPELETWLLSVPVIRRDPSSGRVTIKLASLTLRLHTDDDGKVSIASHQIAKFTVIEYELLPTVLKDHSSILSKKINQVWVEGYKTYFTSKHEDSQAILVDTNDKTDTWFHFESPGQISIVQRLRKVWRKLFE